MNQPEDDEHTADQWRYHMDTITDTLRLWRDGDITTGSKRRTIAQENARYYGADKAGKLGRTPRRYELPAVLAEAAGVPEEAMVMALNARRHGGREAYDDILATARVPGGGSWE